MCVCYVMNREYSAVFSSKLHTICSYLHGGPQTISEGSKGGVNENEVISCSLKLHCTVITFLAGGGPCGLMTKEIICVVSFHYDLGSTVSYSIPSHPTSWVGIRRDFGQVLHDTHPSVSATAPATKGSGRIYPLSRYIIRCNSTGLVETFGESLG